jgi:rRNA-processing protein FCF1
MKIGRQIVVFDTSSVRNVEGLSSFLGGRKELERFASVCEIVLPDMVVDEIKKQKRDHLTSKRKDFLTNPMHSLLGLKKDETETFDLEDVIKKLEAEEVISYKTIELTKTDSLNKIKSMCLACQAPFGEKGDKGFKDAYILLTVEEYLESIDDEMVFLVTNDDKLTEAASKYSKIRVVKNFEDFEKFSATYFVGDYFIGKLREEVSEDITPSSVTDASLNIDGNWVLKIEGVEYVPRILVDFKSKDILGDRGDFDPFMYELLTAEDGTAVDSAISELRHYQNMFIDKEILELLKAAINNDQIYLKGKESEVRSFFVNLYSVKKYLLNNEEQVSFEGYYLN